MKSIYLVLFLVFVCFSCQSEREPEPPQQYTLKAFYDNKQISGGYFSPDASKLLVSSKESGIYNAMALPVDGSAPVELTQSEKESIFALSYFPEDERILYTADQGGNEINHIYRLDEDGTVTDLTPGEQEKAQFRGWSRDRSSFYYSSNKRDPQYFDFYKMGIDDFESEVLFENSEGLDVVSISNNERFLALLKAINTNNAEMYLYDRASKTMKHLSPHEGDALYSPQYFSLDDQTLYYLTDEGSEFRYLVKYDLAAENKETVFETDWDIWYAYESFNGKYRVIGINEDGRTKVHLFEQESGKEVSFPEVDGKSVSSVNISNDEKHMRITASDSRSPSDIYVHHFKSGETRRLTDNLNPNIQYEDLVEAEVVRFKSFDGLDIPAIYYKPQGASAENKVPAMVWVHGGPGGQTRASYSPLIQCMVNHGYAVLAVNNRGSSGYGKSFYKMDDLKHGDVDLKDCIYGKKYLQTFDYIDPDKIGIIGGSYGGYMTMAALTFAPEEFEVGVNIFGVTNWKRTLKSIPPWWTSRKEALYSELGDPYTADSVRLYEISPVFHTQMVTKPLIVLQGANDPRVLQIESDEIVEKIRENGVPVEYVLFEDEGHGFRKKENEIEGYNAILKFLDQYLKKEPPLQG